MMSWVFFGGGGASVCTHHGYSQSQKLGQFILILRSYECQKPISCIIVVVGAVSNSVDLNRVEP